MDASMPVFQFKTYKGKTLQLLLIPPSSDVSFAPVQTLESKDTCMELILSQDRLCD